MTIKPASPPLPRLSLPTERELEVLQHVFQGKTSAQIAGELGVTRRTVEFHLGRLYGKWKVRSRLQACQIGLRLGVLTVSPRGLSPQAEGES